MPFGGTPSGTVERCQLQSINLSPSISPQVTVYKAGEDEAAGVGDVPRVVVISHLRCENHSKNEKNFVESQRPVVIVKNNLQCFRLVSIQLFCMAVIAGDLFPSIGAPMKKTSLPISLLVSVFSPVLRKIPNRSDLATKMHDVPVLPRRKHVVEIQQDGDNCSYHAQQHGNLAPIIPWIQHRKLLILGATGSLQSCISSSAQKTTAKRNSTARQPHGKEQTRHEEQQHPEEEQQEDEEPKRPHRSLNPEGRLHGRLERVGSYLPKQHIRQWRREQK